jgi:hypothetical protein
VEPDQTGSFPDLADHDRSRAIAEQRGDLLVHRVDDRRVDLGGNHEAVSEVAGDDVLRRRDERVDEPGAGRLEIEGRRGFGAEPLLNDARRRRKRHVRCVRRAHDQIELPGGDPRGVKRALGRDQPEVRRGNPRLREPPLADPRSRENPLLGAAETVRQLAVVENALGQIGAGAEHPSARDRSSHAGHLTADASLMR